MPQYKLIVLVMGIFLFCIYWLIHGSITYWIYRDSSRRGISTLGWAGSYIGVSFLNMLIWIFVLLLPFIRVGAANITRYVILSAILAVFSIPSLLAILFYSVSSRKKVLSFGMKPIGEELTTSALAKNAFLINLGNPGLPETIPLFEDETTFGRDDINNVVISHDPLVSREHAKIKKSGTIYELFDRGSENLTFVEREGYKEKISRVELKDGDIVYLGPQTKLQFKKLF